MSHEGIRISSPEEQARGGADERPLSREAVIAKKVRVMISEGKGMEIEGPTGTGAHGILPGCATPAPAPPAWTSATSRDARPGQPKAKPADLLPMYAPPAKPASAHAVGRYAIQFNWLDGHSAGIYSFEYLRRHCQCGECRFASGETTGAPN